MTACIRKRSNQTMQADQGLPAEPPGREAHLPVYAVTPFTMLDYPGKTACIIWFSGCNMRCGYCHNPQIVKAKGSMELDQVFNFLRKRRGLLDGVVLSGGEATVYYGLTDFAAAIRDLGYAVKLDTNGTRPDIVRELLERGLVNYIALDYKAPPRKFRAVTGIEKYEQFGETLAMLCAQDAVPFEVRTTVHTDLLDERDIDLIIGDLEARGYAGSFYVQNFTNNNGRPTLGGLPAQKRILDTHALRRPDGFDIACRNFPS